MSLKVTSNIWQQWLNCILFSKLCKYVTRDSYLRISIHVFHSYLCIYINIIHLPNQYAGQEATVRTRHGTDWFQIGKGVHQGCILSPCLFNLYADYISEMLGWMKHKLESRFLGEISITSDMQMTPSLWQKVKRN